MPYPFYKIIEASDAEELAKAVDSAMYDRWMPHGGVAVTVLPRVWTNDRRAYEESIPEWRYSQAMTRGA